MDLQHVARRMWTLLEPIHAVTYFSAEARSAFEQIGLRGFWRGYFAGRAAPLGPVAAAPVVALFNSFAPPMVDRALPAVWDLAAPDAVLAARAGGAHHALRPLVPDAASFDAVTPALQRVVAALDPAGRALGAANAALLLSDDPYGRCWQTVTTLREHRGDSHVAAAVAADLAGLDLVVLRCGIDMQRELLQPARGWTDDQWAAAVDGLAARGLVDPASASATAAGRALVRDVEEVTDQLAARAWSVLTASELTVLAVALLPIARACAAGMPTPNPIGWLSTWDPIADPDGWAITRPGSTSPAGGG